MNGKGINEKAAPVNRKSAVFIASSDNTFDVFSIIAASMLQAFDVSRYPLFVGLNDKSAPAPFKTVSASVAGWRQELHFQLSHLPDEFEYIILLLDDFFVRKPIQPSLLAELLQIMCDEDVDYLRLKPLERSWPVSVWRYIAAGIGRRKLERIVTSEPYYSSLQAAIWKREYLLRLLEQNCSIWDFEHIVLAGSKHYAVRKSFGFKYEHLVEKGRWLRHAPSLLPQTPLAVFQCRGFDQRRLYRYRPLRKMKFAIYGYAIFRIRRALKLAFQSKI